MNLGEEEMANLPRKPGAYMGLSTLIVTPLGALLGIVVGNVAFGVAAGLGFGVVIGAALEQHIVNSK